MAAFAAALVDPGLPPHLTNAFDLCGRVNVSSFKSISIYVGAAFGVWSCITCVDCRSQGRVVQSQSSSSFGTLPLQEHSQVFGTDSHDCDGHGIFPGHGCHADLQYRGVAPFPHFSLHSAMIECDHCRASPLKHIWFVHAPLPYSSNSYHE